MSETQPTANSEPIFNSGHERICWDLIHWFSENSQATACLSLKAAMAEIGRLKTAIREHRGQRGDDRCLLDDQRLYHALGDGTPDPFAEGSALPPRADFLESCGRYWDQRQHPQTAGTARLPQCMTIAELTQELIAERQLTEDLEAGNNRLGNKLDKANLDIERLNEKLTAVEVVKAGLTESLLDLADRADRARGILRKPPVELNNWGMLDTASARAALAAAEPAASPAKEKADG